MINVNLNITRFNRYAGKTGLAALVVAASMTVGATASYAAVVCGTTNLPAAVVQTSSGLYINVVTGVIGTPGSAVPGWDFNAYGATNLTFFASNNAANTCALLGGGNAATTPTVLASGAPIGPAGTYATGGANSAWRAGVTGGYVGIRFNRESDTTTHYGWVQLTTTGPTTGYPATVTAYCYEDTPDTAIVAGSTPVLLQKYSVD